MRFPCKKPSEGLHEMTLLDGEMIIDNVPNSGLKRRYLAYDLMALDSVSQTKVRWCVE
uniref:mRNA capping enzyme adenylation domain-containing protein n=1 Tax=Arundo donax TaxID=35708 RepID=A0A0A9CW81_ARUDO